MNTIKLSKILSVIAIVLLITIPICMLIKINTEAGATKETITSYNDDYVFFVVEEGKTPLASVPVASTGGITPVAFIVTITLVFVLSICYFGWYMMLMHNTRTFVNNLPSYLRNKKTIKGSILHPIKSLEYSSDMAYDIARNYIKD